MFHAGLRLEVQAAAIAHLSAHRTYCQCVVLSLTHAYVVV